MKKKIFLIFILAMVLSLCVTNFVSAIDTSAYKDIGNVRMDSKLLEKVNYIMGIAQVIGAIVAVIMLIIMGARFVTGASQDKADMKKQLVPFVIGVLLLFSTVGVLQIVRTISTSSFKTIF